jgi:hypothetical protein
MHAQKWLLCRFVLFESFYYDGFNIFMHELVPIFAIQHNVP